MSASTDTVSCRAASSRATTWAAACAAAWVTAWVTAGAAAGVAACLPRATRGLSALSVDCGGRVAAALRVAALRLAALGDALRRLRGAAATLSGVACGVLSVIDPVLAALVVCPRRPAQEERPVKGKAQPYLLACGEELTRIKGCNIFYNARRRYTAESSSLPASHVVTHQALFVRPASARRSFPAIRELRRGRIHPALRAGARDGPASVLALGGRA
ncbi:hypothetical protein D3C73_1121510 [compost metagenome]